MWRWRGQLVALHGSTVTTARSNFQLISHPQLRRVRRVTPRLLVLLSVSAGLLTRWFCPEVVAFAQVGNRAAAFREGFGPTARYAVDPKAPDGLTGEEKEVFRALSVTLLQRCSTAEDLIDAGSIALRTDGKMGFEEFTTLLDMIKLECSAEQRQLLFDVIDVDNDGCFEVYNLRKNLRQTETISSLYSEGLTNTALTLIPTVCGALLFAFFQGPSAGFDFITGYIVEDSLSVDNLFVFVLLFKYFKVPPILQNTCLNLGIYGAVVLRAAFIFVGLSAIKAFEPVLLFFAAFLIYASYTALKESGEEEEKEEAPPEFLQGILSSLPTSPDFDGAKLVVPGPGGSGWLLTPLAQCIIAIELCDILFAVDSVPAVFAVTSDPLIVFTSNIAAILGLRSLYQILSVAVVDLVFLDKSVAVVLGFVGVKLAAQVAGIEIGSAASLVFIAFILGGGIALSLAEQQERNESGGLRVKKRTAMEALCGTITRLFSS